MANLEVKGLDRLHNAIEEKTEGEIQGKKEKYRYILEGVEVEGRQENLRV